MIYKFMAAHEGEFRIERMCRVLGVGRSGYYAWRSRPASQRAKANEALLVQIQAEYETSRATYGSPRIHVALQRQGVRCSRKRVARLMQLHQKETATRNHTARSRCHSRTQSAQPGVLCFGPQPKMGQRHYLYRNRRGLVVSGSSLRSVFSQDRGLGDG
jgi:putative transposase